MAWVPGPRGDGGAAGLYPGHRGWGDSRARGLPRLGEQLGQVPVVGATAAGAQEWLSPATGPLVP